jgi:hypothetical protein
VIVRDRSFGQIDPGSSAALSVPEVPVAGTFRFYALAVAAGVTVYFITRWLARRFP